MSSVNPVATPLLISDSSTLINFLRIDRVDLLTSLPYSLLVTDVVRAEITHRYQNGKLEEAITRGHFAVIELKTIGELQIMDRFKRLGLGLGESASIAAAVSLGATLAIDDGLAIKKARAGHPGIPVLTTQDIMLFNIRQNILSVAEANAIKSEWATSHRFKLKISSFAELLT